MAAKKEFNPNLVVKSLSPPEDESCFCLSLAGELAGETVVTFRKAIEPVFVSPTPPRIRLVMSDVKYIDSTGIGAIIALINQLKRTGGQLEIVGLTEAGRQLLRILRIARIECVTLERE